jgi:hypothetical protein
LIWSARERNPRSFVSNEGDVTAIDAFVKKFTAAVDALERDGYWLKPEADQARKAAADSHVGR